jgi:glycosyltransferase involved in cell wall biosynthesis
MSDRRYRIVLCWTDISGYMAACWRALSREPDVDVKVIAFKPASGSFSAELLGGIEHRFLDEREREDGALVASLVKEHRPDAVYVSGWAYDAYRSLLKDRTLASVRKWMGVDTPWRGTLKQQLARVVLRSLVARADLVWVPGERAWQYMRVLGVPEARIRRGLYGVDFDQLAPLWEQRSQLPQGWPRRFLFIGRYHEQKGIDTLVAGYQKYRDNPPGGEPPWPLTCCGTGPEKNRFAGVAGIDDLGFRQPAEIHRLMREHGAFVLASRSDPWPLVVVESCAAGLPVICTEACGSSVELVRSHHNGMTVASEDPQALARGFRWAHERIGQLPEMGRRARELASAYSASMWATRWAHALRENA